MATCGLDPRLLSILQCPRDHTELHVDGVNLTCAQGHHYPVLNGVPVFLLAETQQTIGIATASLRAAESSAGGPLFLDTLGLSEKEKQEIAQRWNPQNKIDAVISYLIGATSGLGYAHLAGRLEKYPIPDIPIGNGNGALLLDIGSNWGRWSVSAAHKGWRVVGVDPSVGALLAAKRAFSRPGLDIAFVCGDARFLPFKADTFDAGFSYSVIQHFAESDAARAISELGRVLHQGGFAKIQMAHKGGFRSTYIRTRSNYLGQGPFRVRYWSLSTMREVFTTGIGPSKIECEAFGGLGILAEDWKFVNAKAKALIAASMLLKKASAAIPPLLLAADSVYVTSTRADAGQHEE
jgi:SAM-dependent methyltransferase/uncharacterized protein YbaR (Trm112 family)